MGGRAGGGEGEVRVGVDAYTDELRGGSAGGEIGVAGVAGGEGVDTLGECSSREGGVSGRGNLRGEEGGCAVEEDYGSRGEAGGGAFYVGGEDDREAGVDGGRRGGERGESGSRRDGEVCGGGNEGVVPCCGAGERSRDGVSSDGRKCCYGDGEGRGYGRGVLLEEVVEGGGEGGDGLAVEILSCLSSFSFLFRGVPRGYFSF